LHAKLSALVALTLLEIDLNARPIPQWNILFLSGARRIARRKEVTMSAKLLASLQSAPGTLHSILPPKIARRLQMGVHTQSSRLGLRRDLDQPLEMPRAKIPMFVRPLTAEDLPIVLPESGVDGAEKADIADRHALLAKAGMCAYVAVDERTDTPCYIQWLLGPSQNDVIRKLECFPVLAQGEALLEGAYTPPRHRGLGVMSVAMAMIAERAADIGARHVLTFVAEDNIASLKGCQRAGFQPHLLHEYEQWGFGVRRRNTFTTLDAADPRRQLGF
jgi:GNAT superfamily N-acetyltransferase